MKHKGRKKAAYIYFLILFLLHSVYMPAQENETGESAPIEESAASGESTSLFTFDLGVSSELNGSGAYYFGQGVRGGFDVWVNAGISGNVGKSIAYFADIGVSLISAEREYLGSWPVKAGSTETSDVYSYPLGYFPYSYKGGWGGFIFPLSDLNAAGPTGWPDSTSIGFNLLAEISGSALNDILQWRIGRNNRETAGIIEGSSLVLNKAAQPFTGYDIQINPLPGFYLYSLTGALEYYDSQGISTSPETFQNAFSLSMFTYNFRQYVKFDIGTTAIWPKRFELGYLIPFTNPLLYQNNIGDYDNISIFGNLKLQYPSLGFLWFSLYVDEINFEKEFFHLDREMYAYQAGIRGIIPFLAFSSVTVSYTKIEPYCYTHQKTSVPWYDHPMEESYVNHGYGLGYYLPPNSDELKAVFSAMADTQTSFDVQFQMIRHGADYGEHMVDGSSYLSELKESDRSSDPELRKDFLHDGAYQWLFVLKAGGSHTLKNFPLEFSVNAGVVFSHWKLNNEIIDNTQYPSRTGIVADIGIRIFY